MNSLTSNHADAAILGCILLFCTVMSGSLLSRELRSPRYEFGADGISIQVERFAELRSDLEERRIDRVGFVTDDEHGRSFMDTWFIDEHIARYALRPVFIPRESTQAWVVGSFVDPKRAVNVAANAGLELVRDYGDGVFLYRRGRR
jgi:hypothetical protein